MSLDLAQVTPLNTEPPAPGHAIEVAPGILWTRIPLPFRLNHVNVYLLEDGDGWAIFDTGLGDAATQALWEQLTGSVMQGRRVNRIIASHFHPDHIGCAGWLSERFDAPLWTGTVSYLFNSFFASHPGSMDRPVFRDFFQRQGMEAELRRLVSTEGYKYQDMITPLPPSFRRIVPGEVLTIGGRSYEVLSGEGHAAEQLMLYCRDEGLMLVADQVLARISPNVAVSAMMPDDDPLGGFLATLRDLKARIEPEVLALPGHHVPFRGLHPRCDELIAHHEARCDDLREACALKPRSVTEMVSVLFPHVTDPHQFSFAFGETLAHVNHLLRRGTLVEEGEIDGVRLLTTA